MTTSIMETAGWLRFVATARHGVLTDVVTELRQASGFVALTGCSGVGKTTLARAARDLDRSSASRSRGSIAATTKRSACVPSLRNCSTSRRPRSTAMISSHCLT